MERFDADRVKVEVYGFGISKGERHERSEVGHLAGGSCVRAGDVISSLGDLVEIARIGGGFSVATEGAGGAQ